MSQTKVSDALRNVTAVDAAKITTGTIPEARIATLDATKLTGDIALARLDNAPATDTTSIQNDISLLALQTAMNGNMTAFGLKNSWIEQFENSTYIANLTDVLRNASEYIGSVSISSTDYGSGITPTYSKFGTMNVAPTHSTFTDGNWQTGIMTTSSTLGAGWKTDLGAIYQINSGEITIGNSRGYGDPRQYTVTYSTTDSNYLSNWDFSGCTNNAINHSGSSSGFSGGTSGGY